MSLTGFIFYVRFLYLVLGANTLCIVLCSLFYLCCAFTVFLFVRLCSATSMTFKRMTTYMPTRTWTEFCCCAEYVYASMCRVTIVILFVFLWFLFYLYYIDLKNMTAPYPMTLRSTSPTLPKVAFAFTPHTVLIVANQTGNVVGMESGAAGRITQLLK